MRVLLTGAAGFIGSRVAARLLDQGHEVIAVDRPDADRARLGAVAPRIRLHAFDLVSQEESIGRFVLDATPEACIHLAWYAVPGLYLDSLENIAHLRASLALLTALTAGGCRRFVSAGTCFEYETSPLPLGEESPTAPRFLYSATKLSLFLTASQIARLGGAAYAHVRFFYQYGPWEHADRLVPSVMRALLSGREAKTTAGAQLRDFLHVDDVARAVVAVTESALTGPVNIGSGEPISVADLVRAAADACGRPDLLRIGALPYRPNDPMSVCANVAKLRSVGWAPRFDLRSGIRDAADYWRRSGGVEDAGK